MRAAGAIAVILLSAASSGCWSFQKKAPKPLPPLTPPVLVMPAPAPPVDLPPEATTPIHVEPPPHPPEVTIIKPELQPRPEKKPAKPQPKPVARRPAAAPPLATPAPAVAAPAATAAPESVVAPPPQLGELISEQHRMELRNEIDQSLERARGALSLASRQPLTRRQSETANRVRVFVRQAEEAKSRDISTAVQLARRADLLAQDLVATFK